MLHIGGERGGEAEDAEEVVAGRGQPPGGRVGHVAEAAGRLQDPTAGLLGDDASLAVGLRGEHQGHGRLGHPREPGHLGLPWPCRTSGRRGRPSRSLPGFHSGHTPVNAYYLMRITETAPPRPTGQGLGRKCPGAGRHRSGRCPRQPTDVRCGSPAGFRPCDTRPGSSDMSRSDGEPLGSRAPRVAAHRRTAQRSAGRRPFRLRGASGTCLFDRRRFWPSVERVRVGVGFASHGVQARAEPAFLLLVVAEDAHSAPQRVVTEGHSSNSARMSRRRNSAMPQSNRAQWGWPCLLQTITGHRSGFGPAISRPMRPPPWTAMKSR